jgi:hypothetical protein
MSSDGASAILELANSAADDCKTTPSGNSNATRAIECRRPARAQLMLPATMMMIWVLVFNWNYRWSRQLQKRDNAGRTMGLVRGCFCESAPAFE